MLSRLSLCGSQNLRQCILKFQPAFLTTSAGSASENTVQKDIVSPPSGHFPEYPPPTSKRDFINFPKTFIMRETPPPVRMGFIPETWFHFMYPKTGYTGPYIFMFSVLVAGFSKEIIIMEHNFFHFVGFVLFCVGVQTFLGDKIALEYNKAFQKEVDLLNEVQDKEMVSIKENLANLKKFDNMKSAVAELTKANTELIQLQMENAFRDRVADVFSEVKSKLDCQAELERVERRMVLKNMIDYVIHSVMSSITPDLEKNALQACISDLNALAARP